MELEAIILSELNTGTENQVPHILTSKWELNIKYIGTPGNNKHWSLFEGGGWEVGEDQKTIYQVLCLLAE